MNNKAFFAAFLATILVLVSIANIINTNNISIAEYAIVIILISGFFYIGECIKETKGREKQ
jgi:hypothetical protein